MSPSPSRRPTEDPPMTLKTWAARLCAAAIAAVAVGGSTAQAGLLPVSVTVTPEAGNFRWTYAVVLPTDMKLQAGDYFTVYDFGGLVSGSATAPDGWSVAVDKPNSTPARLNPQDDTSIP